MSNSVIPDPTLEPVISIERAGRCLGMGRTASYAAAQRGELPTLSIGRRLVVPSAMLLKLLGFDVEQPIVAHQKEA